MSPRRKIKSVTYNMYTKVQGGTSIPCFSENCWKRQQKEKVHASTLASSFLLPIALPGSALNIECLCKFFFLLFYWPSSMAAAVCVLTLTLV